MNLILCCLSIYCYCQCFDQFFALSFGAETNVVARSALSSVQRPDGGSRADKAVLDRFTQRKFR